MRVFKVVKARAWCRGGGAPPCEVAVGADRPENQRENHEPAGKPFVSNYPPLQSSEKATDFASQVQNSDLARLQTWLWLSSGEGHVRCFLFAWQQYHERTSEGGQTEKLWRWYLYRVKGVRRHVSHYQPHSETRDLRVEGHVSHYQAA